MTNLVYIAGKAIFLSPTNLLLSGTWYRPKEGNSLLQMFSFFIAPGTQWPKCWSQIGRRAEARESLHVHPPLFGFIITEARMTSFTEPIWNYYY